MITIVDTIRAISGLVERVFGEPPTTKDITEGFDRPSSYVQVTKAEAELTNGMLHEEQTFEIIRFGERTDLDYLQMLRDETTLTMALTKPIHVLGDFYIYPDEVESEIRRDEMVLIVTFSIENFQLLLDDEVDADMMETLTLNQKPEKSA